MKVALVYDRVNKWGGAERVLLALHQIFPDAPLYTSVYSSSRAPWAKVFQVHSSFLQNIPLVRAKHELIPFLMPMAFESFSFDTYDMVISVTSEAAKGIITSSKTKHLCYCLTPTRYLWSGYDTYFANTSFKLLSQPAVQYLRKWDYIAAQRPDKMIAISHEIQERIQQYYQRDSSVIYPPLLLQEKKQLGKLFKNNLDVGEPPFLLIVSRLVPYKRIDLAIRACNRLRVPLRIVGTGNDYQRLRTLAGPTVRFVGTLTDDELITYYKNCRGFIFPGQEDFGLTVLEAQYYGKPVLALEAGGAKETIIPGKTGMFFSPQSVSALSEKLAKFISFRYNPDNCRKQAQKFTFKKFEKEFVKEVEQLLVK